jgi:hypothetical protein
MNQALQRVATNGPAFRRGTEERSGLESTLASRRASYRKVTSMTPQSSTFRALALLLLAGGLALAQSSTLPSTRPTTDGLPTAVPASSLTSAERATHRAEVVYSDGQIEVTASNSSLNQILRDVARATGMKITGGVTDERVYGKYGPAPPAQVLANLLQGTGSNMLFRESVLDTSAELVLTPRQGGPTPPNPNAAGFDDDAAAGDPPVPQPRVPFYPSKALRPPQMQLPFSQPAQTPAITSTQATPQTPPPGGIVDAPTVDPATEPGTTPGPGTQSTGTSDPASPNGVKTPQQIYLELQQLQQQQANPK